MIKCSIVKDEVLVSVFWRNCHGEQFGFESHLSPVCIEKEKKRTVEG